MRKEQAKPRMHPWLAMDTTAMNNQEFYEWFRTAWQIIRSACGKAEAETPKKNAGEDLKAEMAALKEELRELDELVSLARERNGHSRKDPKALKRFSNRLRGVMGDHLITQKGLSMRLGYNSSSTVAHYVQGQACPSEEMWGRIKEGIRACVKDNLAG